MTITPSEILAWSLIAPTPQCCYHAASNSHIVYWKGVAMVKPQAMMLVHESWLSSYATPSMKLGAYNQLKRAYHLGAFGEVDWNYTLKNLDANAHYIALKKWLYAQDPNLWKHLYSNHDIKTAMSWFTKDYETVI